MNQTSIPLGIPQRFTLIGFCSSLASCTVPQALPRQVAADNLSTRPLKVASWNLEFLAEKDGAGCEPRTDADYTAMRQIVDTLDADVIAFQEAENEAAAARVFDPKRYTIVMEKRPGAASGSCGGKHPEQQFIRQAVGFAIRKGIAFDSNPAGYARILPSKWTCSPDALARLTRSGTHPFPLGRVGGMSWGAATGGFLVTRWNEKIEQEQVSTTATRWFRDTGEFWGIDGRFVGSNSEESIFATEYAAERWAAWLTYHYRLCRALGGAGAIHVKLGLVGLEGSRWPRGLNGVRGGPGALEDSAGHEFVFGEKDAVEAQINAGVDAMMRNAATAYGL